MVNKESWKLITMPFQLVPTFLYSHCLIQQSIGSFLPQLSKTSCIIIVPFCASSLDRLCLFILVVIFSFQQKLPSVAHWYNFFSCVVIQHIGQLVRFSTVFYCLREAKASVMWCTNCFLLLRKWLIKMKISHRSVQRCVFIFKGLLWGCISVCKTERTTSFY